MKRIAKIILGIIAAIIGAALIFGGVTRIMNSDWSGIIWIAGGLGLGIAAFTLITNGKIRDFFEMIEDAVR